MKGHASLSSSVLTRRASSAHGHSNLAAYFVSVRFFSPTLHPNGADVALGGCHDLDCGSSGGRDALRRVENGTGSTRF